jgi:hypothetical protein
MKKITATLGSSHSDFDRQVKDLLNEMRDVIGAISSDQQTISEHQHKLFLKQHAEILQSSLCNVCHHKAEIITIVIADGNYKSFCNKCVSS